MKNRIIFVFPWLLLMTGLSLILIYSVTFCHNETKQYQAVKAYIAAVEESQNTADMFAKAESFNVKLSSIAPYPTNPPEMLLPENNASLDIMENSMVGYISVPDEGILLPIYHGADEKTM